LYSSGDGNEYNSFQIPKKKKKKKKKRNIYKQISLKLIFKIKNDLIIN